MITNMMQYKARSEEFKQLINTGVFLIVDDNRLIRKTMADQLSRIGVQKIIEAENGADALKVMKHRYVSFVLTDWNMPVMDGLQLLRTIRSNSTYFHIPVVMVTAEAERNKIELAINSGVTDLLVKPFSGALLEEHIARAIRWNSKRLNRSEPLFFSNKNSPTESPSGEFIGNSLPQNLSESKRSTILIADSDIDHITQVTNLFKDEYDVISADSGTKIVEICKSGTPPALILMEAVFPDMDGFNVVEDLRNNAATETIPVIFISTRYDDESRIKGLNLGALYFIPKPINPEIVHGRVVNLMGHIELSQRLQHSYDQMLELARLRDEVDHIARHDLKSPLIEILGISQNILSAKSLDDAEEEKIKTIIKTTSLALNMVTMSSIIFKIETGRFVLNAEDVNICKLVIDLFDEYKSIFADKGVAALIECDASLNLDSLAIKGDHTMCYSAFHNLLKNAFEAAPMQSTVTLKISKSDQLSISINNTGAVPKTIREHFFEKFSTSGKDHGTGLGTYSAKLLLEAQGASLEMTTSDQENSTCVTTKFPL